MVDFSLQDNHLIIHNIESKENAFRRGETRIKASENG